MLLAALGVGVFAAYVQLNPAARRVPDSVRRPDPAPVVRPSESVTRPTPRHTGPSVEIQREPELLVASVAGDHVKLVPAHGGPKGEKPIVFVANETLRNLKLEGARAIGVEIKDRIASIDFNPKLTDGMGSMQEATVLKALQMTFGQFKEIDAFEMRIDGEVLDTLGGHFELENPVPVIRLGKSEPDADSSPTPSEDPASEASR
jgi:hypothetical protein